MNHTWKLKGTLFFFHSAMTIIISYMPVYFQALGLSGSQIGILLAVGPFAAILSQPFWGYMSDRWKTVKYILLTCLTGALIVGFIVFQMNEFVWIMFLLFIFFAFMSPAGGLGDSLAQKVSYERGVSFGSIRMWGSLGFGTSSLVSGYLLAAFGIQNIYYLYAFFLIIAILFCTRAPDSTPSRKKANLKKALLLGKDPVLALFLIMIFLISLTHRMNDTFLGLYIVELGGNEAIIGTAWFIGVITEAVVFAASAWWLRRFHPLTFITFAAVLYVLRWLLMGSVSGPGDILYLQILHGLTFGVFYLTAFQFVARLVPDELTSTGHLLFISVFFGVSGVIGSLIGGAVIDTFMVRTLYYMMFGFALLGLFGSLFYRAYYFRTRQGMKDKKRLAEMNG
ncbi:MFS transporter [Bacillus sp. H-16]|uniref:MFS transporter n=1 Tax=Alteribacter salitolerans TaxID=2912333 RepID=UPI0019640ED2|nr:MFS transporter [Alteribacter salitolerans]MBM7094323.1 MFS transporter [Alteribacter salitolerans]